MRMAAMQNSGKTTMVSVYLPSYKTYLAGQVRKAAGASSATPTGAEDHEVRFFTKHPKASTHSSELSLVLLFSIETI
jgi:hypothetical protein